MKHDFHFVASFFAAFTNMMKWNGDYGVESELDSDRLPSSGRAGLAQAITIDLILSMYFQLLPSLLMTNSG